MNGELEIKGIDDVMKAIEMAQKHLKKSLPQAVTSAGLHLTRSLIASTKQAKKKRRVVKMSAKHMGYTEKLTKEQRRIINDAKTYTPYGAMVWDKEQGREVFVPFEPKHTRLAVRTRKKTGQVLLKNLDTGEFAPESHEHLIGNKSKMAAQMSSLATIRYAGLAKQSWRWTRKLIRHGGEAKTMGVESGFVMREDGGLTLRIVNKLDYITEALTASPSDLLARAGRGMQGEINRKIAEAVRL